MNILIAGGGQVGALLAKRLIREGNAVTIVDPSPERCAELYAQFDARVVTGNAARLLVLREAGIGRPEMVIAVTDHDEVNLLVCQIAQVESNARIKVLRLRTHEVQHWHDVLAKSGVRVDLIIHPETELAESIMRVIPTLLIAGMLLGFISTALTAVEIRPLAKKQGLQHGVLSILAINLSVKFYNQFLPTSLVGSGIRWCRLSQPGNKIAESLAALAFFRLLETFLTFTIGLGFYLTSDQTIIHINITWLVLMILGIMAAWILITRYSLPIYQWFNSRITPHLPGYAHPFTRRVEKFFTAVSAFTDIAGLDLLVAILAGVASTLSGIASGTVLAQSLNISISFVEMGWVLALVTLLTQLPFAAAGGLGLREVTIVALLTNMGVGADRALALTPNPCAWCFNCYCRRYCRSLLGVEA